MNQEYLNVFIRILSFQQLSHIKITKWVFFSYNFNNWVLFNILKWRSRSSICNKF